MILSGCRLGGQLIQRKLLGGRGFNPSQRRSHSLLVAIVRYTSRVGCLAERAAGSAHQAQGQLVKFLAGLAVASQRLRHGNERQELGKGR
jgi:hypothetical protein